MNIEHGVFVVRVYLAQAAFFALDISSSFSWLAASGAISEYI